MKLTVRERLLFIGLYPEKSDLMTQTIIRDIAEKVRISDEEAKEFEMKFESNRWSWNPDKEKEIDVEFSSSELQILKDQVEKLNQEKSVTQMMLDICKKIKDA